MPHDHKERPILFSGEMVRAILEGRKTQTRRIVNVSSTLIDGSHVSPKTWRNYGLDFGRAFVDNGPSPAGNPGPYLKAPALRYGWQDETTHRLYPKWQLGDLLWVRETWGWNRCLHCPIHYRATEPEWKEKSVNPMARWYPSIHMPRSASRITLEVCKVRIERLAEITTADVLAEGIHHSAAAGAPIVAFKQLWDSLNAARGFSWDSNPWVWVVEFRRAV